MRWNKAKVSIKLCEYSKSLGISFGIFFRFEYTLNDNKRSIVLPGLYSSGSIDRWESVVLTWFDSRPPSERNAVHFPQLLSTCFDDFLDWSVHDEWICARVHRHVYSFRRGRNAVHPSNSNCNSNNNSIIISYSYICCCNNKIWREISSKQIASNNTNKQTKQKSYGTKMKQFDSEAAYSPCMCEKRCVLICKVMTMKTVKYIIQCRKRGAH